MKGIKASALILSLCVIVCGIPVQISAQEFSETDGGDAVQALYEEEQEEMEITLEEVEEQQELNAVYSEIEEEMTVNIDSEGSEYEEEYAGAYIEDENTILI